MDVVLRTTTMIERGCCGGREKREKRGDRRGWVKVTFEGERRGGGVKVFVWMCLIWV